MWENRSRLNFLGGICGQIRRSLSGFTESAFRHLKPGAAILLISALNGILAASSASYVLVLGIYYKLQTFLYLPASGIVQRPAPAHWLQLWRKGNEARMAAI